MTKSITVPGEFAGITEEIAPGENTFEDNGSVYASGIGVPVIDKAKRSLSVKQLKNVKPLLRGDIVVALVAEIYDSAAQLHIMYVENADKTRTAIPDKVAFMRISEIQSGYVEQLRDHVRIGDVIRAKVIEVNDLGTNLSILNPDLGVIKAICTRCRGEMQQTGSTFTCNDCGSKEQRKTAQFD
ncbi:MAG: exosome complex RNA-binding protein Csl4 [Candidatus Micrarchaeota archaeon]